MDGSTSFTPETRAAWHHCKPGHYWVEVTYNRYKESYRYYQPSFSDAVDCANYCAELALTRGGASIIILSKKNILQEWQG